MVRFRHSRCKLARLCPPSQTWRRLDSSTWTSRCDCESLRRSRIVCFRANDYSEANFIRLFPDRYRFFLIDFPDLIVQLRLPPNRGSTFRLLLMPNQQLNDCVITALKTLNLYPSNFGRLGWCSERLGWQQFSCETCWNVGATGITQSGRLQLRHLR